MTHQVALPAYYNDLDASFAEAWNVVEAGVTDRNSPAHTPTVGTVDADGTPQLRIMILRAVSRDSRSLRFHTDARSEKIAQLQSGAATSVLVYDAAAKAQIRLSGRAHITSDGDLADTAWSGSTPFARRCYMAEAAPGTRIAQPSSGLPEWIEGKQPEEEQLADYRGNFAALMFQVDSIEWLYLANAGHRRARWQWDQTQNLWLGRWLVP
ncbi:MAG: pyridoxamine 5'-phosphate oxidase family protein [Sphingorhabdus sp.]|uniref:pyridoxamine 5'-phosphate oxidase family protein n=1 Tax=Sphingorhabdus sp. TaxID=1902408 RepID=UPI00273E6858|nr:pyridoxamine 5'-phosphate oxidase family protein [Sphingorhabdus sp.]MDP4873588.1 pyridoxamine 5'-phosphate oxidase family protein [Sphingorhabdus sp.]